MLGQFDLRGAIRWLGTRTFLASTRKDVSVSLAGANFGRPPWSICIDEFKCSATVSCRSEGIMPLESTKILFAESTIATLMSGSKQGLMGSC